MGMSSFLAFFCIIQMITMCLSDDDDRLVFSTSGIDVDIQLEIGMDSTSLLLKSQQNAWVAVSFGATSMLSDSWAVVYHPEESDRVLDARIRNHNKPILQTSQWALTSHFNHNDQSIITLTRPNHIDTNPNHIDFNTFNSTNTINAIWAHGTSAAFNDHGPSNRISGKLQRETISTTTNIPSETTTNSNILSLSSTTNNPTTAPPTTNTPTTAPPTTNNPTTSIPTTNNPTTAPPTTNIPTESPTCPSLEGAPNRCSYSKQDCCVADSECLWREDVCNGVGTDCCIQKPSTTQQPTYDPTMEQNELSIPFVMPSSDPTSIPTTNPIPTKKPTLNPTRDPTDNPTSDPTDNPTEEPTDNPTLDPT